MPKTTLDSQELHRLARIGAVARLQELEAEAASIRRAFPGVHSGLPVAPTTDAPAQKRKVRKRKTMSAEAKKAIGERMKAYWAARRQAGAADVKAEAGEPARKAGKRAKKAKK